MGGLVFDLHDAELLAGHSFIPDHQRLHVTPRGIRLLAKCGLLPHITIQEIDDKSKTDETAKLLCCVQVTWILVQTITRLAIGLAISPLEINTLGHVICALMMYALWWHKPRWVKEPITLRGDWTPGMCAFMYVSSQVSAEHRRERSLLRNFGVKTELSGMSYTSQGSEMLHAHEPLSIGVDDTMAEAEPGAQASHPSHAETSSQVSANNDRPSGGRMTVRNSLGGDKSVSTTRDPEHIALEAMRQVRWKLVCDAIEQYPAIRQRLKYPEHNSEQLRYREALQLYPEMPLSVKRHFTGYREEEGFAVEPKSEDWTCFSEELVVDRPRNWPGDELVRHMQGHLMGMILWFSSTIYGAVHLAGWNQIFPTAVEQWFWRASAAYIVFSGLLWSFLNLLGHVSGHVWLYWYDFLAENVQRRSHILIYILSAIGGTAYVIARTYLVVEAFVSLRALPASAFESPSWILTVPHIS